MPRTKAPLYNPFTVKHVTVFLRSFWGIVMAFAGVKVSRAKAPLYRTFTTAHVTDFLRSFRGIVMAFAGVCDPWNEGDCVDKNSWLDCSRDEEFVCDYINDPSQCLL